MDIAPDDTIIGQSVDVHASWVVELARAARRPWRSGARWAGAWMADRDAMTNQVILVQPIDDPADVIGEVDSFVPAGVPYTLSSPWPTPDLSAYGLVRLGRFPLMARFPGPPPDEPAVTLGVREVADSKELALAQRVLIEGYPFADLDPDVKGQLLGSEILGGPIRLWLAWLDGEAVAVAGSFSDGMTQLVFYVATLPSARRNGAGAAVSWAATLADPALPAVLVASDQGRPVYERMGYVALGQWNVWQRRLGSSPGSLRDY